MRTRKERTGNRISKLSISSSYKEIELEDKSFWISQKPIKRLQYIEVLRKINYGKEASKRLQRVFKVTKRA